MIMSPPRYLATLILLAGTLAHGNVQATEACEYANLVGEALGECGSDKEGPTPGTLEELLKALEQRLPKVLRDRCTEDEDSACECHLWYELEACWANSAVRTPLVKWFMDQGVAKNGGIAELVVIWLKRRIHGQDLRIQEEVERYLASFAEDEMRYRLGWTSGRVQDSLLEERHPEGSLDLQLGELVPYYNHFFFYAKEHAKHGLVACWRKIPLRHPGIEFEISTRLYFVPKFKKWNAQIDASNLPEEDGKCIINALSGLELPDYYGPGPYEVKVLGNRDTIHWYSTKPAVPTPPPRRFPWLWLGVVSVIVTAALFLRRRLGKRGAS